MIRGDMRPYAALTVILTLAALRPVSAPAQQPPLDSLRMMRFLVPIQVDRAMVLAVVADSLNPLDQRFSGPRAVAESLGFNFDMAFAQDLRIVDRRYHAVYSIPSTLRQGYVIIVPGHRPDLLWSWVEPDSLRRRLMRYRLFAGPLVAR